MHLIGKDDLDFEFLEGLLTQARSIGTFNRDGTVQRVKATDRLVLVSSGEGELEFIAIQPARNMGEAESLALSLLWDERRKGNTVIFEVD
ncbi:MAG: hypothetical protein KDD64_13290 [Bdellovibrionales bacterium]|nr:hypothetical protein [Bdellovibrionales bacterium]